MDDDKEAKEDYPAYSSTDKPEAKATTHPLIQAVLKGFQTAQTEGLVEEERELHDMEQGGKKFSSQRLDELLGIKPAEELDGARSLSPVPNHVGTLASPPVQHGR